MPGFMSKEISALHRIMEIAQNVNLDPTMHRVFHIARWAVFGYDDAIVDRLDRAALLGEPAASSLRQPPPCVPTPPR